MVGRFLLCCHRNPLSEGSIKNTNQKNKKKKIKKTRKKGLTKGRDFGIISGHSARGKRKQRLLRGLREKRKKVKKPLDKPTRAWYNKLPR